MSRDERMRPWVRVRVRVRLRVRVRVRVRLLVRLRGAPLLLRRVESLLLVGVGARVSVRG